METIKSTLLLVVGIASGSLVSGGVFTTLIALGLLPRFAGKTHTARHVLSYEDAVILGTWFAMIVTVWPRCEGVLKEIGRRIPLIVPFLFGGGGFFSGCFVGSMALAIAEMLDGIPIFARRISLKRGVGVAVLGVAVGKIIGSLLYFWFEIGL